MFFRGRNLAFNRLDFFGRRRRGWFAAHEANHALCFFDKIPRFLDNPVVLIQQHHIYKHVTGPKFARRYRLLLVANLHHLFHRHQDFFDKIAHLFGLDALFDTLFDLLFLAREGVNNKPLASHDAKV